MFSTLKKLITVGLIFSTVYVLFYLAIQTKYGGIFKRNIMYTTEVSSNNEKLLKNGVVNTLVEEVKGAVKEDPDIKKTGQNVMRTTGATILPNHKTITDTEQELSAKQRAEAVEERCKRFLKESNRPDDNVRYKKTLGAYVTSRRYNLTMCINAKVASSNAKRILYTIDNNFTGDVNRNKKSIVNSYSRSRFIPFQQVLKEKDHVSVMFIREPMERLLSAYRDDKGIQSKNGPVTFKDYLQQILDTETGRLNQHMYPYYENCRPCEKQYDFIASQKTFPEDMNVVLKEINAVERDVIPDRAKTGYSQGSEEVLQSYYKDVPNDMIHKLWEKYKKDYYIFGFPYPSHLMNNE